VLFARRVHAAGEHVFRERRGVTEADGMRLLVLGGTRFLGSAVVAAAVNAGWSVTTLTRGKSGYVPLPPAVDARHGDRATADGLAALDGGEWDVCIDTCGFVPRVVGLGAARLAGRVGHYVFVSSLSAVPSWPDEPVRGTPPRRDCPPDAGPDGSVPGGRPPGSGEQAGYGDLKAGCERAVEQHFPDSSTQVEAGLIVGPAEDIGRLPYWLHRVARGGEVLAGGRPDQPVQLVDTRDLAAWMLRCGAERTTGRYAATSPPALTTFGDLLAECVRATGSDASVRWVDDEFLLANGVEPWSELPLWMPLGMGPHAWDVDTGPAEAAGLVCRPLGDTVADTWQWLRAHPPPPRSDRIPAVGMAEETEKRVLALARRRDA
jgi:2'-hydroxyisoflavone reductase